MNLKLLLIFICTLNINKILAIEYIGLLSDKDKLSSDIIEVDKSYNEYLAGNIDIKELDSLIDKLESKEYIQFFKFYTSTERKNRSYTSEELSTLSENGILETKIAVALYLESMGAVEESLELLKNINSELGKAYYARLLIQQNIDVHKGIDLLEHQSLDGNKYANFILGAYYSEKGAYEKANKYLLAVENEANIYALHNLALNYYYGRGVEADIKRATLLFEKIVKKDIAADSAFLLGRIYLRQNKVKKATVILKNSSDSGNAKSSFVLGKYYIDNIQEEGDLKKIELYFERARKAGLLSAYYFLVKLKVVQYSVFKDDKYLVEAKKLILEVERLDNNLAKKIKVMMKRALAD